MTALAKIISAGVHNECAANDALWADELDQLVGGRALAVALTVSLEVTEITDVTVAVLWSTVFLVIRID